MSDPSAPAEPGQDAQDALQRVRAALSAQRRDWIDRYGEAVCELEVGFADGSSGTIPRIVGQVLVPAQRAVVASLVDGLLGGREFALAIEALTELEGHLGWCMPAGACLDVLARPEGPLATQLLPTDPPARRLARRGDWWALELADATVGWSHAADLRDSDGPGDLASWRAAWRGAWLQPDDLAWRRAVLPWLGTPYRWGGNSPEGIDCSGLSQRVFRKAAGIGLPKHSRDQLRAGRRVAREALAPGDLVYLTHRERRIAHVGIVLDGPERPIANASFDANAVVIEPLDRMLERYLWRGARRFDAVPTSDSRRPRPTPKHPASQPTEPAGQRSADQPAGMAAPASILTARQRRRDAIRALSAAPVHVVGLASTEGAAMLRFLWSEGLRDLTVHDLQPADAIEAAFMRMHVGLPRLAREALWRELGSLPVERRFGERYLEGIDAAEAIFAPQAWYLYPPNLPVLAELKAAGLPFLGLMGLYFDLAPAATLAFTGSNGKSTSSRLAETILRLTDQRIYYAGNERRSVQVLDRLDGMRPEDWLILEVSNRHLKEIAPRPRIGVVTNVLPNHLDEHDGSFEAYAAVKARLLVEQGADDLAVLNADNPATLAMAQTLSSQVFLFSRLGEVPRGAWLDPAGRIKLRRSPRGQVVDAGPAAASRLPGAHNQENILAAALASYLAGASPEQIQRGIGMFRGLRHRCQFVWAAEGVSYFDDLNSTTPRASMAALEALPGPINWIAGGDDKGLDYEDLARLATRRCRRVLLLPGAGSDRLAEAMQRVGAQSSAGLEVLRPANLREAVARSVALAEPGDTVLLSPACPFFFSLHYLTEGDREAGFKSLLRELTLGDSARRARQEEPQ
ncbi:MAG: UDP-N-acetylmuramoyl-L-alanine--D-glutamate ligase [Caldilineae bacterium]|nr:UDP-N-acetylmuramoyl-L-alanine--D-glutamate ligase [Caldilineae bacterium]